MSNEEILEELMWKAHLKGFHAELMERVTELVKLNPLMSLCTAVETIYRELNSK